MWVVQGQPPQSSADVGTTRTLTEVLYECEKRINVNNINKLFMEYLSNPSSYTKTVCITHT